MTFRLWRCFQFLHRREPTFGCFIQLAKLKRISRELSICFLPLRAIAIAIMADSTDIFLNSEELYSWHSLAEL